MKFLAILAGALALVCSPALAQSPNVGKPATFPNGYSEGVVIYCDDGTGHTMICSSGGGGGGGDASAANQTSVQANAGSDATKAIAVQGITGGKAIPVSGTFWQATQPISATTLTTLAGAVGTVGSAVPTTGLQVGGTGPSGNYRAVSTDTRGGLLPGQGQVSTTRTTLTASTATALEAAGVTARILESVTTEAALAANVYICSSQTTSCSATNYDFLLPSGAGAGTTFTAPFATQGRLYAYSTGTPVLVLNSWTAQ